MARSFVFVLSSLLVGACSSTPAPSEPTASPDVPGKQLQGNGQGPATNPDAPVPAGSSECGFMVGAECFRTAEAGCKAAGCEASACLQLETMPVQIQCKK